MIHTATLVHDDIIDSAAVRRGRVTANHRWGNQLTSRQPRHRHYEHPRATHVHLLDSHAAEARRTAMIV